MVKRQVEVAPFESEVAKQLVSDPAFPELMMSESNRKKLQECSTLEAIRLESLAFVCRKFDKSPGEILTGIKTVDIEE